MLEEMWARLDQFAARRLSEEGTPGAAIALTDRERTLGMKTYGHSDLAVGAPVAEDTLFEIGSIAKSFTAIALLADVDRSLDLQAPVATYLPWFEVRSGFEHIAIHHLLSHTGGITTGRDFTGEAAYQVWSLRHTDAAWAPGTRFHYSNLGFKALGLVLEALSGRPYQEVIAGRVLRPLGMTKTHAAITRVPHPSKAVGYEPVADDRPWIPGAPLVPAPLVESATGDGSIVSCAPDMARYVRMFLRRGAGLLTPHRWGLFTQQVIPIPGRNEGHYGYGVATWKQDGNTHMGHGGSMPGFQCEIDADLDAGVGAAVLLNGPGPDREIAHYAVTLAAAAIAGHELPEPDDSSVDLTPYEGTYSSANSRVVVSVTGKSLLMHLGRESITLHPWDNGGFVTAHPEWGRFPLTFERSGDRIAGFAHGGEYFFSNEDEASRPFQPPEAGHGFEGHYRSHNPWYSNFRVVLRRSKLVLVWGWGEEMALHPTGDGWFGVGESPDKVSFEAPTGKDALCVRFAAGGDFYRTFTP